MDRQETVKIPAYAVKVASMPSGSRSPRTLTGGMRVPSLIEVVEVRAGIAAGALLTLAAVVTAAHTSAPIGTLGYLGLCLFAAAALTPMWAAAIGLAGWGFLTGFVVNAGGQLTFHARDLERLAALVVLSLATSVGVAVLRERSGRTDQGTSV